MGAKECKDNIKHSKAIMKTIRWEMQIEFEALANAIS